MQVTRKRIAGLLALGTLAYGLVRGRKRIAKGVRQVRVKLRDFRKKDEGPDDAPTESPDLVEVAGQAARDDQTVAEPKDDASDGDGK